MAAVAPLRGRFIRSASAGTGHAAGPRTRTVRIDDPDPGLLEKTMTRPLRSAACCPAVPSVTHWAPPPRPPRSRRPPRAARSRSATATGPAGSRSRSHSTKAGSRKPVSTSISNGSITRHRSTRFRQASSTRSRRRTATRSSRSAGAKNVMILLTDYSAGNDMIVAKPPLRSVEALKGKKVGVELGLVDHLLLETALQKHGLKDGDVTLVNAKPTNCPKCSARRRTSPRWPPGSRMQARR